MQRQFTVRDNVVELIGNLTKDVRSGTGKNGQPWAAGSLACESLVTFANGSRDLETVFVDVMCFGAAAAVLTQYGKKGLRVGIRGQLVQDNYEKKVDGKVVTKDDGKPVLVFKLAVRAEHVECMQSLADDDAALAAAKLADQK